MKESLAKHKEIASYLDEEIHVDFLTKLIEKSQDEKFYIPIIGQYSAGKTSFLNALLGIDYLPTRGTETTALATFISYGERDEAFVEYKDGTQQEIAIEELIRYRHGEENEQLSDLQALHLKIKNPILQTGVTFVDTPGFNTLAKHHEEITLNVIAQADFLIYVMGKSMTDYDLRLFRQVQESGLDLILVRTKLDEVKHSEESLEDLIEGEKSRIHQQSKKPIVWFGVSTDSEALHQAYWKSQLDEVRQYLKTHVVAEFKQLREQYFYRQLRPLSLQLEKKLKEQKINIQSAKRLDNHQIQEQIVYLEQQGIRYEQTRLESSRNIQRTLTPLVAEAMTKINGLKSTTIERFLTQILRFSDLHTMQQQAQELASQEIMFYLNDVKSLCQEYSSNMIAEGYNKAGIELGGISEEINEALNLEFSFQLILPSPEQLDDSGERRVQELTDALEILNEALQQSESDLKEMGQNKAEMNAALQESMQAVVNAKRELEQLGAFDAPMKWVEGDKKASEAMKQLGSALDVVMMFVPVAAPVKAAGEVGKFAKLTQNLGKSSDVLQRLKQVHDIKEGLEKAKNIKDIGQVSLGKQVVPSVGKTNFMNVFKGISLEYWFEKAGHLFDTPSYYEADQEAHLTYSKQKKILEERQQQAVQQQMAVLESHNFIQSQEAKLKNRQEINAKTQKTLVRELELANERAKQEAKKAYGSQLKLLLEQELQRIERNLTPQIEKFYRDRVNRIVVAAISDIQRRIDDFKDMLNELISNKSKTQDEHKRKAEQDEAYLNWLSDFAAKREVER